MREIHPTAIISPGAELAADVVIGPYVIIEDDVIIGEGTRIAGHACIKRYTVMGSHNTVHSGAVLGDAPQAISFKDTPTSLTIGSRNVFREHVTIHRASAEGDSTIIGDDNFIMAAAHAGHDCVIGNGTIITNCALLAGHVEVEDKAVISGAVAIHQFCRIGRGAMVSGLSAVNKDVPPFVIAHNRPAVVSSLNTIGMKRAGISAEARRKLKAAFKTLYLSGLNISQAVAQIEEDGLTPEVTHFIDFIKSSKRGISRYGEPSELRKTEY